MSSLRFCASMLRSILYFASVLWKFITKPINCEQICTFPLTVRDNQVSDWLILYCGNLILHPKKEMKTIKTQILWQKTTNKCQKRNMNVLRNIFLMNSPHWPVMQYARTLQRRRNYIGIILSDTLNNFVANKEEIFALF